MDELTKWRINEELNALYEKQRELLKNIPTTKKLLEVREETTKGLVEQAEDINELIKARLFIEHIKAHLEEGQVVICKICGKSIEEVWKDNTR